MAFLRPFANLLCVYEPEPAELAWFEAAMQASGEFDLVRPASGWLVGIAPLPESPPEPPGAREAGLFLCEGADRVLDEYPGRPPAAVAGLALDEPGRLASLPGDFTFVAFGPDGDVTAVRSCAGVVPMYMWTGRFTLVLGTRMDYFVRFLREPPPLDPLVNAIWTTGRPAFPDHRSFLQGVTLLDRSHYLRISRGCVATPQRYWDPRPQVGERLVPDPERPSRLRELLISTLMRDLSPDGGNLLSLSGGVDSSSLGALGGGVLGIPMSALTFLAVDPGSRSWDERYVDLLASRFSFVPHWRIVLDVPKRIELLLRPHIPCAPIMNALLGILSELQTQTPVRVVVGGESADQVAGTMASFADWAQHTSLWQLLRGGPGTWPTGSRRDVLRWAKRRALYTLGRPPVGVPGELSSWVTPEIRAEYAEWRDRQVRAAAQDRRPLRQLALGFVGDPYVTMNWEGTSTLGIRRSLPFFNREVLELAFSCHPSEQLGPGPKKLLRRALQDDVPAENLQRQDKGIDAAPKPPVPWHIPLDGQLQAIVRADWFPCPPAELDAWDGWGLAVLVQIARSRAAAVASRNGDRNR